MRRVLTCVALLSGVATAARAQVFEVERDRPAEGGPRRMPVFVGVAVGYAVPQRAFRDNVRQGVGGDATLHWKVDRRGILSLGGELGFLGYGRETRRVPLSPTLGGRILVDLTTSNNIFFLGAGPMLVAPSGPIRPYASASAGVAAFWTESSVRGDWSDETFAQTTNHQDATLAWTGGGGVLVPLGRSGRGALDVGVRWHDNGRVRYLRRGDIVDLPNGTVQLRVREGEAPFLLWRVGGRWGLF